MDIPALDMLAIVLPNDLIGHINMAVYELNAMNVPTVISPLTHNTVPYTITANNCR